MPGFENFYRLHFTKNSPICQYYETKYLGKNHKKTLLIFPLIAFDATHGAMLGGQATLIKL